MRPHCTDCHPPKPMQCARIVCGPFAWRGYVCPTCNDALFLRFMDKWGFRSTRFLFRGEILLHDAHIT